MNDARLNWAGIDYVLLDMDGTVLDLAFDNYFWGQLVPQRYAQANGLTFDQAMTELEPKFRAIEHTLPWYCLDHWSRITGLDIAGIKREVRERVAYIGGSRAFLEAVRASGRPLWLVTNAHPDSWQTKLDHLNLRPMFDCIVSSHDLGAPKEDPAFWDELQRRHPFPKQRALFADDSAPVLRAARNYGVGHIVAMRHPDSTRPPRDIAGFDGVNGLGDLLPI